MDILSQEITLVMIGTAFFLLVAIGIIVLFLVYQKKQLQMFIQKQQLENQFHQELLNTRLEVQEHTLNMVGQEIHDNVGQLLAVVKLNLHSIQITEQKMSDKVHTSIDLVNRALSDLRNLSKILNPEFIASQPLSSLITREITAINRSELFKIVLEVSGNESEIPADKKIILFRMAQECLQNAIKHSKAHKIVLRLSFDNQYCSLKITDDGVGFNSQSVRTGNGFYNLKARAALLKSKFEVTSKINVGTEVGISVPI